MHVGRRVNAADWDNVGTVIAIADGCGEAAVRFVSSDGKRTHTKILPWDEIRPIDHPEPAAHSDVNWLPRPRRGAAAPLALRCRGVRRCAVTRHGWRGQR